MLEHAERLAEMAVAETGLGRVTDKIVKNRLVTDEDARARRTSSSRRSPATRA